MEATGCPDRQMRETAVTENNELELDRPASTA
jgi:hypothetical protein